MLRFASLNVAILVLSGCGGETAAPIPPAEGTPGTAPTTSTAVDSGLPPDVDGGGGDAGAPDSGPPPMGDGVFDVLLLGNSLTTYKTTGIDVPKALNELAKAEGLKWKVESYVKEGASLQQFAADMGAKKQIESRYWDAIVLQDNRFRTYSSAAGEVGLTESGAKTLFGFARASEPCTRAVLYAPPPWSISPGQAFYNLGRKNAVSIGKKVSAEVAPALEAFRAASLMDPKPNLYADMPNADHPNAIGGYVLAVTVFSSLSGIAPGSVKRPSSVSAEQHSLAQKLAYAALASYEPGETSWDFDSSAPCTAKPNK